MCIGQHLRDISDRRRTATKVKGRNSVVRTAMSFMLELSLAAFNVAFVAVRVA
jgi:hypothetical protein